MADFESSIKALAARVPEQIQLAKGNEEATKTSFINPFIRALGYDTTDLTEVIPEYNADTRGGSGRKVDYAIQINREPVMFFECKASGVNLTDDLRGQLKDYFASAVNTRIGVLTNGAEYEFFTDIDNTNVMDDTLFWTIDLREELSDESVKTLSLFAKKQFDSALIKNEAAELKYVDVMKSKLLDELKNPTDNGLLSIMRPVSGMKVTTFKPYAGRAIQEVLHEQALAMLASSSPAFSDVSQAEKEQAAEATHSATDGAVITETEEEREAFEIVKSILQGTIDESRLSLNDTKYYCAIVVDGGRAVCRLRFGARVTRLGLFDADGGEVRYPLETLYDINGYSEQLRTRAMMFA